jgi:hypothetical protein
MVRQSRFHVIMANHTACAFRFQPSLFDLPHNINRNQYRTAPQRALHDTNLRLLIAAQASRQDVGYGNLQTEDFAIGRHPLYRMIASDQQHMTQRLQSTLCQTSMKRDHL